MSTCEALRQKLIEDMDRLGELIVRVARGEKELTWERDRLEGAVNVKLALLWGMNDTQKPLRCPCRPACVSLPWALSCHLKGSKRSLSKPGGVAGLRCMAEDRRRPKLWFVRTNVFCGSFYNRDLCWNERIIQLKDTFDANRRLGSR